MSGFFDGLSCGTVMPLQEDQREGCMEKKPSKTQGQYLAFIHYYTKLHRRSPAEADMERYFRVTPPTVHQMVLTLEKHGFISRIPGKPRSIQILLVREEFPDLE